MLKLVLKLKDCCKAIFILLSFSFLTCIVPRNVEAEQKPLKVGVTSSPPFSYKTEEGLWTGIAVDIWGQVSHRLKRDFIFKEISKDHIEEAVETGEVDAAISPVIEQDGDTPALEYSHPFYESGIAVAVSSPLHQLNWRAFATVVFNFDFLKLFGFFAALTLCMGVLMWLAERHKLNSHFVGPWHVGLESGLWWSLTTLSTVGYGDKTPRSRLGRIIATVWIFGSILMVSSITAAVTATLLESRTSVEITSVDDLLQRKIVSVSNSSGLAYLKQNNIPYTVVDSPKAALLKLLNSECDGVVLDAPTLSYEVTKHFKGRIMILPHLLERQEFAFALPIDSPLHTPIDSAIIHALKIE